MSWGLRVSHGLADMMDEYLLLCIFELNDERTNEMGMKVTIDFLLLMEGGDVILTSAVAEEN
jgi:hypothetical protein